MIDFCVEKKYLIGMETSVSVSPPADHPDHIVLRYLVEKNQWLIRLRWFYPVFVLFFAGTYRFFSHAVLISLAHALPIFLLAVLGNLMFKSDLRRRERKLEIKESYDSLLSFASLQLDFDVVVLSLFVYFSGGLGSPAAGMYIFYVMISTFLIDYQKAFRNTITSIALIFAIFLLYNPDLRMVDNPQVSTMLTLDILLIFAFAISGYLSKNIREKEELLQEVLKKTHELSIMDGLTGLYNQSHFFELLDQETATAKRYNQVFSLIIFDVDNFKNYNDNNGHILGSATLKQVGAIMKRNFRSTDILAKYGGDEFVIILPQTDKVGAYLAAERLRETIERTRFEGGEKQPKGCITISMGLASFPEHGEKSQEVLDKADQALYFSKKAGRNRATIFNDMLLDMD